MSAYDALVKEANDLGLPRHYKSDLTHDKKFLEREDAPGIFGWVIYDCGTHLVDPYGIDGVGKKMPDTFRDVFQTMFNTDRHCYVWTGTTLLKMKDADSMIDYLEANG